jgi:aspartyl-tRNA(Asn)/glutamyl-tRNA(Gln) amidotransferase subunit B
MFKSRLNTKCLAVSIFVNRIASLTADHNEPNTQANYVDLGFPGMLPVLNEDCLDKALRCGLALAGRIPNYIKFDRKHYNYPDLPQGY